MYSTFTFICLIYLDSDFLIANLVIKNVKNINSSRLFHFEVVMENFFRVKFTSSIKSLKKMSAMYLNCNMRFYD